MDADSGLCAGCWRTLDEIARWSRTTDDDRRAILAAVEARRDAGNPGRRPGAETT